MPPPQRDEDRLWSLVETMAATAEQTRIGLQQQREQTRSNGIQIRELQELVGTLAAAVTTQNKHVEKLTASPRWLTAFRAVSTELRLMPWWRLVLLLAGLLLLIGCCGLFGPELSSLLSAVR